MYPLVSDAVGKIIPLDSLRWITFGHVESDECGAMNLFLAAAPRSEVIFNPLGCDVSLNDLCDRPPVISDGSATFGGADHALRIIMTPHVPHGWEAQVLFDETTRTLFCGDLFSSTGDGPALLHDGDIVGPALAAEDMFHATSLTPVGRPDPAAARRPRAPHPGDHARSDLRRRLPAGAARPGRRLRHHGARRPRAGGRSPMTATDGRQHCRGGRHQDPADRTRPRRHASPRPRSPATSRPSRRSTTTTGPSRPPTPSGTCERCPATSSA